jgi:hypothetical protein
MSIFCICRRISFVATHDMPGMAPIHVGRCMPGFPTVATLTLSMRSFRIASSAKNVKKTSASMPSMRAPLAMIRPG